VLGKHKALYITLSYRRKVKFLNYKLLLEALKAKDRQDKDGDTIIE